MKKIFTLIELLIVIGIMAILATTVVLVLNPAQLLAQARDSQRMSDLGSVKSAIALYLATASSPTIGAGPYCTAACAQNPFSGTETVSTSTAVTGAGWVAVDLTGTTGGSPLASLPLDPTNNSSYHYAYAGNNTEKTFELNAILESTKYSPLMANDKDGGDHASYYEIGTEPGLDL